MACRCEHCGSLLHDSREWSEAEDFRMADLLGVGMRSADIARQLGRSVSDVRERIASLRLLGCQVVGIRRKVTATYARTLGERVLERV